MHDRLAAVDEERDPQNREQGLSDQFGWGLPGLCRELMVCDDCSLAELESEHTDLLRGLVGFSSQKIALK